MKYAACYATIMSVQGRHCLLIELKLRNVSTCLSVAKPGAERKLGAPPGSSLERACS